MSSFGSWIIAGAGIAVGAAVVSAVATGVGMMVAEGIKMLKSAQASNGGMLPGGQTQYMPGMETGRQAYPQR